MENSEFLFVTAEIGVAFTGFAGLVTALARRKENQDKHRTDASRLRMVLVGSIITVLLSLLPFVVARFVAEGSSWAISALVSAMAIGYFLGYEMIVPAIEFRRAGIEANISLPIFFLNALALFAAILTLLIYVFIHPALVGDVYIAAIYVVIFTIGNTLVRFFVSLAD